MKKLSSIFIVCGIHLTFACTTFGSLDAASNSIIIAKNRDNNPDKQIIQVVATPGKFKYLALSRADVPDFVSAGINEKNLAVFNEVTMEYSRCAVGGIADDFSQDILQNYAHVRDVIPDLPKLINKFPDPVFYQVADNNYLLSIEVAPHHQYSYKLIKHGIYAHTNNYQSSELIKNYNYNYKENKRVIDSTTKFNRATYLVNQNPNLTLDLARKIALDQNAGSNDSIYRVGLESNPNSIRSLAFIAIEISRNTQVPSKFRATFYAHNQQYNYSLDKNFWRNYTKNYNLVSPN